MKTALFSMHPDKAPGPDGMSHFFFQRYWNICKNDIVMAVQSFLFGGHLLKALNETIVTLIPKVEAPINLSQYRPISLCNVIYRVIAKVLANRLKRVIPNCISYAQSAFVPGRQIIDNVILTQELLHFMKNKRTGKNDFMILKLDLSKAYDRAEWQFLGRMMMKMGFCSTWVKWILNCVTTATYSFNVNGQKVGYVKPSRGIRQGDPLSPYLFLICAEGLSNLMNQRLNNKALTGVKVGKDVQNCLIYYLLMTLYFAVKLAHRKPNK